ncbi:hypothetical protein KAI52_01745 [Candidatus Parcubacteria bacterium]|nr:hypothetical protein [Candidatus Parcubacteria bacterium]
MNFFKLHKEKKELIIINFFRFIFAGLIIFELLNYSKILRFSTQFTWLGLVITSTASLILLEFVAHKYKQLKGNYLHWSIWLIVTAGLSLDAFGDFFHFYSRYNWWDQFAHFFISAVVCFTLFIVVSAFWIDRFRFSLLLKTGRLKLSLLLAATGAMSLSAIYEVEEYLEDVFFHTNRLGPGTDTANDLFLNLTGILTVVASITIYYLITRKRKILE